MRASIFVLGLATGACATAAVQSAASSSPTPSPAAESLPPVSSAAPPRVVALDQAERRIAPGGKGSITVLARGRNAFLGKLEMPPGGQVPVHRDATEEYIHVLSGHGEITIDGQTHALAAGATVYMPADAEVSYRNGDEALVAIQVFAGPEPAAKYDTWSPRP